MATPTLPEGWTRAETLPEQVRVGMMRELLHEVGTGHVLHGRPVTLVAVGPDDGLLVSFDLAPPSVALVHLTWRRETEAPPWPMTVVFADLQAFSQQGDA